MGANKLLAPQSDKLKENYFDFHPDIIIEATNACNRACKGCYAANIIVNENVKSSAAQFISAASLDKAFKEIGFVGMTSVRGGEPSIHPYIEQVLKVATQHSKSVIIETHGRWITQDSPLLKTCKDLGIIIKVSFDSMHGLSADQLFELHTTLTTAGIQYLVAITENTLTDFMLTRTKCPWLNDDQVIYQKKASKLTDLIKPKIGVIKTDGSLNKTLSTKSTFLNEDKNV